MNSTALGRCGHWISCATPVGPCWCSRMWTASLSTDCSAHPWSWTLLKPGHRYYGGCGQASPARPRPQGHQAGQYPGQRRNRRGAADRVRHRLTVGARAPVASSSRDDRRHARLHGARADRTDESVDRFPQRPLRPRRHLLPNAHRCAAVYGRGPDGMGALPPRQAAHAARRAGAGNSRCHFGDHHEAAREDGRRPLPDRRRSRERSSPLPDRMEGAASD